LSENVVNIVGVGNVLMGDDGIGPAAVEALAARALPAGAALHDAGLAVSDVLGTLDPQAPLVVIDAVRGGAAPGRLHRLRLEAPWAGGAPLAGAVSLHEISVLPALRIEALTGRAFRDVTVFGVEPGRVAWGEGLSPPVAAAIAPLADAVAELVDAKLACTAAGEALP